jgi:hypothetical protein
MDSLINSNFNNMAEKQLVEFALEDGTTFLVEVDKQPTQPGAPKPVSLGSGVSVTAASKKFDQALDEIKPVITTVVSKLKDITPTETEIKFGVKLTANAGIVFSSLGSELTFEITVKWNNKTA